MKIKIHTIPTKLESQTIKMSTTESEQTTSPQDLALGKLVNFLNSLFSPNYWVMIGNKIRILNEEKEFEELYSTPKDDSEFNKIMRQCEETLCDTINSNIYIKYSPCAENYDLAPNCNTFRLGLLRMTSEGDIKELPCFLLIIIYLLQDIMAIHKLEICNEKVLDGTYHFVLEHKNAPTPGNILSDGHQLPECILDPETDSCKSILQLLLSPLEYISKQSTYAPKIKPHFL